MSSNEWKRTDPTELAKARTAVETRLIEIREVTWGLQTAYYSCQHWPGYCSYPEVKSNIQSSIERLKWQEKFYSDLFKGNDGETYFGNVAVHGFDQRG